MKMYDNENTFQKSFDKNYLSEELLQAQWSEFVELKKVITQLFIKKKSPITILDIGIGNARIAKHLSGIEEIWNMIEKYDGTDNAQACVNLSNQIVKDLNIDDKVYAYFLDATDLSSWNKKYDLIITTWFTAGNFYPDDFDFNNYEKSNKKLDLSSNKKFKTIFSGAYHLLNPDGETVIGACYKDNESTRKKQEKSYLKMGMTVITNPEDTFTATREGFWSQRFTEEKLKNYLSFVSPEKITILDLDTYEYAMQVRIKKQFT